MLIFFILSIILLLIAIGDFLYFRIENGFIIAILLLYTIGIMTGSTGNNFIFGFLASITCFIVGAILNYNNLLGGGDVKLIFALTLFAEEKAIDMLFTISIVGFVIAIIYMIFNKQINVYRNKIIHIIENIKTLQKRKILVNVLIPSSNQHYEKEESTREIKTNVLQQQIPYGIALCVGGAIFAVQSIKILF